MVHLGHGRDALETHAYPRVLIPLVVRRENERQREREYGLERGRESGFGIQIL